MLYTFLILASRRAILDHKPTSLSSALGFLVRSVVRQLEPRRTAHCASRLAPHAGVPRVHGGAVTTNRVLCGGSC